MVLEYENFYPMEETVAVTSLLIFGLSVFFCMLPKYMSKVSKLKGFYSFSTVFAAGLQLATILVDLIPHMNENGDHDHSHHHKNGKSHGHNHNHSHNHAFGPFIMVGATFIALLGIDCVFLHTDNCSHSHEHTHNHTDSNENTLHNHEPHNQAHTNLGTCNTSSLSKAKSKKQAISCLLAISIHSFFEGLSVTSSKIKSAYTVGLLMHKLLESFSLGVSISQSAFTINTKFLMVILYSTLTPFGILSANSLAPKVKGIQIWFNALSLGSMLFIVCIEMIGHSFNKPKENVKKLAILSLGYTLGCVLVYATHV